MNTKLTVKKIAFTLGLLGIIFGLESAALAEYKNPNKPNDGYQVNEQSTTGGSSFGAGVNPLDFIHNINLKRSRGADDFDADTQTNLQNAAEKFKLQQQQRFQNQPSTTPTANPATKN